MGCYAFREAGREETFSQHVLGIVKCYEGMWEYEGFKKKVSRIHNLSELVVGDLLLLSAVIHDLGKAKKKLQDMCSVECTSFRQHYITSAQLALKLGYAISELNLSPDNIEEKLKKLICDGGLDDNRLKHLDSGDAYLLIVVLPVLLHHYAQVVSESSILDGLGSAETYLEIHEDCATELTTIINEVSKSIKSGVCQKILGELRKVAIEKGVRLSIINNKILNESKSYEYVPERFIIEAATGLLNLCDSRVASRNRRRTAQQDSPSNEK